MNFNDTSIKSFREFIGEPPKKEEPKITKEIEKLEIIDKEQDRLR